LRSDDIDLDIYHRALLSFRMPKTRSNRQTAKLFVNGRSQAVRLPAEFRFEGKEVFIRRDPRSGDVILSRKPDNWDSFLEAIKGAEVPEDVFRDKRSQGHAT
jgi:antitoxin VapB